MSSISSDRLYKTYLPLLWFLMSMIASPIWADQTDTYIRDTMQKGRIPGFALAVVKNGKTVKMQGYGYANLELGMPVTSNTIFQLASVSKQFIATSILQLVAEGKIKLDDSIEKYLPNVPSALKSITVRQLLTHTSGIGDSYEVLDLHKNYTEEEILKLAFSVKTEFPSGTKWSYSNTGYDLLGIIIGKVTGEFYGEHLHKRIFRPLGMTTARIISEADIIPNRASGYQLERGMIRNHEWVSPTLNTLASGSIYVSVVDMVKWDKAIRRKIVLTPSMIEQMWTPVKLTNGKTYPYGFGWEISLVGGRRVVEHEGLWQGFTAYILHFRDNDLSVILLVNLAEVDAARIAHDIAYFYLPKQK